MFFKKNKNAKNNCDNTNTSEVFIVVGLGNPGDKYSNTMHNVGFDTIDLLCNKFNVSLKKLKFKSLYGEGKIANKKVVFVKPQTFMNLSGQSIQAVKQWYKVPEERIIIIFDDIDLPMGTVRVKRSGSAGTHNGMKSAIYQLGKDNFPRVKIGIGPKPANWDLADYVLSHFSNNDREIINKSEESASLAVEEIITNGVEAAMIKYNGSVL